MITLPGIPALLGVVFVVLGGSTWLMGLVTLTGVVGVWPTGGIGSETICPDGSGLV